MRNILFPLFFILLISCSQGNRQKKLENEVIVDKDSLLIDDFMNQQKFSLVKTKIDSLLPLKSSHKRGYYYQQKGFCCLMLEEHTEAISNFQKAISLGY